MNDIQTQIAADNCEVLRARLAKYEDAEGRPLQTSMPDALSKVGAFLLGEDEIEGCGFGETPPLYPKFWWRKHLRAAMESQAREIERLRLNIAEYNEHERCYQSELAALKAQPARVVLPERKHTDWRAGAGHETPNHGWNACLDEVARLNSSPVSAGGADERAAFEVCGVTVRQNEVGDWEYLSEGYGNDPDIWVACSDILGPFGGSGVDGLLTAYAELQARAALTASAPNTAQPEVAENTGSQAMATHQLHCQGLAVGRGVEGAATSDETPSPDDIFAWATFDGEGGYDLRLYQDNESYLDEFISMNGDKYASWVFPLYRAALSAPSHSEQVRDGWQLVPVEPTPEMLDVAVSFALNVSLSGEYNWSSYMRDVWLRMLAAAPSAGQKVGV